MNIYLRYFDDETLVSTIDEALMFLSSVVEHPLPESTINELAKFVTAGAMYPKRFKTHGKSYFIVIKTTAANMEEFKSFKAVKPKDQQPVVESEMQVLEERTGWYEASMLIRRAVLIPELQKYQYLDTPFVARLKATSTQDCFDRMMTYLRNRGDLDCRSQFPSAKSKNFECIYLGEEDPRV